MYCPCSYDVKALNHVDLLPHSLLKYVSFSENNHFNKPENFGMDVIRFSLKYGHHHIKREVS